MKKDEVKKERKKKHLSNETVSSQIQIRGDKFHVPSDEKI